ncbi:MAG: DnaJ domain-containing protein [Candidatus Shikimatogenerans sp. AspAUS03]|uniref:DnaJ domain-containing protein n=1 Tax=Candidatus Shikimatogenerans sp. AspAUS03 TaxID=3158563 RepID=A0AAU7QUS0_9FLAO
MGKNYYEILGVEKDSTLNFIKKKYKELALKYHPDRSLKNKKKNEKLFKKITEAYNVLSDYKKRKEYDLGGNSFIEGGKPFSNFSTIFEDLFPNFSNYSEDINDYTDMYSSDFNDINNEEEENDYDYNVNSDSDLYTFTYTNTDTDNNHKSNFNQNKDYNFKFYSTTSTNSSNKNFKKTKFKKKYKKKNNNKQKINDIFSKEFENIPYKKNKNKNRNKNKKKTQNKNKKKNNCFKNNKNNIKNNKKKKKYKYNIINNKYYKKYGKDINIFLYYSLKDIFFGCKKKIYIKKTILLKNAKFNICYNCLGKGYILKNKIYKFINKKNIINCFICKGLKKYIKSPPKKVNKNGLKSIYELLLLKTLIYNKNNNTIIFHKKGNQSIYTKHLGNLILHSIELKDKYFLRKGFDLECTLLLNYKDIILGTKKKINIFTNEITLYFKPGFNYKDLIILKNYSFCYFENDKYKYGDIYVYIFIN